MGEKIHDPKDQNWKAGYHDLYETWTEKHKKMYEKFYKAVYERALFLVCERMKDPLSKEKPNVLLCGTAASETTKNFVQFVQGENKDANIQVLDLNAQPLEASQAKIQTDETIDASRVNFIHGNALQMPLADGSIDLLETDFFLQFFSPENKKLLINEWARVLSEGGAITTREFLPDNVIYRMINDLRRNSAKTVNLTVYDSSEEEMLQLFQEAGLTADIVPMKFGPFKSNLVKHIIAYRKKLPKN